MKHFLDTEERANLIGKHKQERDKRIADRIKAVLWADEGISCKRIAEALFRSEIQVRKDIQDYLDSKKLKPSNGGSNGKLSKDQEDKLIKHLEEVTYCKASDIQLYIYKTYGIQYTLAGVTHWLKQHGFSYKEFKGVPAKADPVKQEAFISFYKKLEKELPEDEEIVFMDSVHPTQTTRLSRGWIKTGTNKLVKTTGSRTRLNIMGAININTRQIDTAYYKTINGESAVEFLRKLRIAYPATKILHVILDQAGYHMSKEVKLFAQKNNIILHFLPPYSPNLNPIERLWKIMNEFCRNNRYFSTAKEFRESIDLFLTKTIRKIKDIIVQRINSNFQRIS